jgi:hypothetical protein
MWSATFKNFRYTRFGTSGDSGRMNLSCTCNKFSFLCTFEPWTLSSVLYVIAYETKLKWTQQMARRRLAHKRCYDSGRFYRRIILPSEDGWKVCRISLRSSTNSSSGRAAGVMQKTPARFAALESFRVFRTHCISLHHKAQNPLTDNYHHTMATFITTHIFINVIT